MQVNRSFSTCLLVVLSMTALNVVLQYFFCEKTLNIVAFSLTGLATLFLLSLQASSIHLQYTQAKIVANRRYVLIKLIKAENGQGKLETTGAVLGFWSDDEKKQVFFFEGVEFTEDPDFCKQKRFVSVIKDEKIVLQPLS